MVDWQQWTLLLMMVGIAWRLTRYFIDFPFWQDEAKRAINLLHRPILDMSPPFLYDQLQPALFAAATQILRLVFSSGEWVFRLIPLLAGSAALILFYRFARQLLEPLAVATAIGLLAISHVTVQYATEFKPYAVDLLMAVVYLMLGWKILQRPERFRYFVGLVVLMPLSIGFSYPSLFLIATVTIVVLPTIMKKTPLGGKCLFLLANLLALSAFVWILHETNSSQFHKTNAVMVNNWWQRSFPPANPLQFLVWVFQVHLGAMSAYPVKAYNLCAFLMCILALLGVYRLIREKKASLLALMLLPYLFTFIAACLRKYPYGGESRVAQHLLPGFLLLAGMGLSVTANLGSKRFGAARAVWATHLVFVTFLALAIYGIGHDFAKPYYYDPLDVTAREVAASLPQKVPANAVLYAPQVEGLNPSWAWYLTIYHPAFQFASTPTISPENSMPAKFSASPFLELYVPTADPPIITDEAALAASGWQRSLVVEFGNISGDKHHAYRLYMWRNTGGTTSQAP